MANVDVQCRIGAPPSLQRALPRHPNSGSYCMHRHPHGTESRLVNHGSGLAQERHVSASASCRVASGERPDVSSGTWMQEESALLRARQSTLDVFSLDDVGGLPLEIWREVISYMSVPGLLRCTQVCKSWRHLVNSLDAMSWRRHFSQSTEWRQPAWPTFEHRPTSKTWQMLYKEHYLMSRIWALGNKEPSQAQCLYVFRKRRESKLIRVGPNYEHPSLKSALAVAGDYDRILLAPGLYDEQFEMTSKIPFELVGEGPLGSVALLTCIEQNALTARLCNLVLRAPWFTAHVLKIVSGHLQVDNCTIEDGQVSIISPGSAHFRYCSFVRTQVTCSHVTLSVIENSDFSECETCAVVVEGRPTGDTNWAHKYLMHTSDTYNLRKHLLHKTQSCHEECSITDFDIGSNLTLYELGDADRGASASYRSYLAPPGDIGITDTVSQLGSEVSSDAGEWDTESSLSDANPGILPAYAMGPRPGPEWLTDDVQSPPLWSRNGHPDLAYMLRNEAPLREQLTAVIGIVIRQCRISKGQGGVTVANQGALRIEQCDLCDLQYGIRCLQNAKVVILENAIHRCSTSGLFLRLGAAGVVAGNDIHSTGEAGIDIRKQADPFIQYNRIHHSKRSGIVVLGSGRGTVKANDIYQNREAGIYILYKGDPYVSENRICHGEAAGIAVTESGRGYIGGNLISGNRWGGIDVRHGADPRVTRNLVCNGLADGIVIGTKGCGTIDANIIKGNLGCGIWVMSGQPVILLNQIHSNKDSGIVLVHKDPEDNQSPEESESDSDAGTDSVLLPARSMLAVNGDMPNPDQLTNPHYTRLKFNSVYHNAGHGLAANSNDSVLVLGNSFHGNRSTGVYIRQVAPVTLTDNSVTCNAGNGVHLSMESKVVLGGNGIYDNIGNGLLVVGEATVTQNDIFCNQMSAISLELGARIQIKENRLFAPYDAAVCIEKGTSGALTNNMVYEGRTHPTITQPSHTTCHIADNNIVHAEGADHVMRHGGADWILEDPPPRPHLEAQPTISIPSTPARHVMSVMRVMTPAGGNCQQGSKMCTVL